LIKYSFRDKRLAILEVGRTWFTERQPYIWHEKHYAPKVELTSLTGVLISPYPDPTEKQLKGRHFSSDAEVIAAAETWLDGQLSELLFE